MPRAAATASTTSAARQSTETAGTAQPARRERRDGAAPMSLTLPGIAGIILGSLGTLFWGFRLTYVLLNRFF